MPESPSRALAPFHRLHPILALVPPLVAAVAQWMLAPLVQPHIWFLCYPAVFVSSWIGSLRSGLLATLLSTSLVWWFFVEPKYVLVKAPEELFAVVVLLTTGVLFAVFHDRLRKTNERLEKAVDDGRIFAAFLANSSDFIGIADANGKPVYVNPAGRRMVGLAPDFRVETTNIPDYYPPDQRGFARDVIVKAMVEQGRWAGNTYFRNWQTGEAIPVSDTHFMIREPDTGRLIGMGTVTRDITDLTRAREEIERANGKLTQANHEITLLYEKVKKLDELKTKFFANVSHELRTPLTLILGPVEKHLRSTADLDPEVRRDLEVVERNARTVLRHVNDLLDVSRIDAGRLKPEYSEIDVAALVRITTDHFSTLAKENHLEFVVDTPPVLPVQTDSEKLERILLNLLSNAFKYTPHGGRVRVSLAETGGRYTLEVGDSGPGIPEDKREVVFERFAQLADDAAQRRGGTGLGLSIVRDLTVLLGGSVSVSDAPEGGALFVVVLPSVAAPGTAVRPGIGEPIAARAIEQLVDELREPRVAVGTGRGAAEGCEGLVLVVEDNRDMSRFIADNLQKDGFAVSLAFDGREGYEKAMAERPDLVLTDVMMPVMSGDDLVRLLRRRPELSSTPIVVLTARADEALRVGLLHEGVQDYLDKPFSVAELHARVRNLIARKRAEDHVNRLRRQLEAVALASTEISEAVASLPEESVRTVFQMIALNAQSLTGAEVAAAGIGGDLTHPFEIWSCVGVDPEQAAKIGRLPCATGLLGFVSREDKTVRLRDIREHPAHRGFPPCHPDIRSFLGVPIRYKGHAVGNLFLGNKKDGAEFTVDDQQLAEMIAARAGAAIETARLYAAEGRAHAWLQAVLDQMPEGIILMDADGRVTMENQSLRALTNAVEPVADRFGNPMTIDLRHSSGQRLAVDDFPIVKAIVNHEVTRGLELIGRRADDRMVPLLVSAAPIFTADGKLAGAAMVCQDVSTLKELERVREEWASIVAHDLRQPIGVISLRSALLLRAELTDDQREDVRQIRASAERLSRMVSDLMDAALLETRRMPVVLERLDLGQFLRDVVERVPLATPRTRVRTPVDRRLFVRADPQRLEQVLTNLLSNAVKYGSPEAAIDLEATHRDGQAEILVTNRGRGIPSDELPMIFERYVRSSATARSPIKGLGIGLYIARGLVEAQGGRIWAESVPDEVTTFHVTMPLDGPPLPADPGQPAESASHAALHAEAS